MRIAVDWDNTGTRMGCTTKWQRQTRNAGRKIRQLGFRLVYYRLDIRIIPSNKKIKKLK